MTIQWRIADLVLISDCRFRIADLKFEISNLKSEILRRTYET